MLKGPIAAALACLALLGLPASAAPDAEPSLRAELLAATWPAEVVRLAADYRNRFPRGPLAADAALRSARAARAQRALENKDVNLSRTAFADAARQETLRADAEQALLGEGAAAWRLSRAYRDGKAVPADAAREVEWLHYAAALDDPSANYDLSRHYRSQAQMPLAARYQTRAVELGFVLPRELDSERK
jgi:TPR repeat protein